MRVLAVINISFLSALPVTADGVARVGRSDIYFKLTLSALQIQTYFLLFVFLTV